MLKKKAKKIFGKKISKKLQGFSFVEAIIAVFVVSIGLVGLTSLLTGGIGGAMESRDQEIAVLLAQEGAELVRNLRDNNWVEGRKAFITEGDTFPSGDSASCAINYSGWELNCAGGGKELYLKNEDGSLEKYAHNPSGDTTGTKSEFSRKIIIDYNTNSKISAASAKIVSLVAWNGKSLGGADYGVGNYSANCTTARSCTYVETILNQWGYGGK